MEVAYDDALEFTPLSVVEAAKENSFQLMLSNLRQTYEETYSKI